jgi:hypothetical protein
VTQETHNRGFVFQHENGLHPSLPFLNDAKIEFPIGGDDLLDQGGAERLYDLDEPVPCDDWPDSVISASLFTAVHAVQPRSFEALVSVLGRRLLEAGITAGNRCSGNLCPHSHFVRRS